MDQAELVLDDVPILKNSTALALNSTMVYF